MDLRHHGESVRVTCTEPVTLPIPPAPENLPPVEQPPGRAPLLRLPERVS